MLSLLSLLFKSHALTFCKSTLIYLTLITGEQNAQTYI